MARHVPFDKFNEVNEKGERLCRWCKKIVSSKRRWYCDDECMNKFWRNNVWDIIRREILSKYPTCRKCGMFQSEEVHHIIPFAERPDLRHKRWNLIALCPLCHSATRFRTNPLFRHFSKKLINCFISARVERRFYVFNVKQYEREADRIKRYGFSFIKEQYETRVRDFPVLVFTCEMYHLNKKKKSHRLKKNKNGNWFYHNGFVWKNVGHYLPKHLKEGDRERRELVTVLLTEKNIKRMNELVKVVLENACLICPDRQVKREKVQVKDGGLLKFLQ